MEVLGKSSEPSRETPDQFANWQILEEMIAKDARPRSFQQSASVLAEIVPGIEEMASLTVADGDHSSMIATSASFARLFAARQHLTIARWPSSLGATGGVGCDRAQG
jgi:hypothetical protein